MKKEKTMADHKIAAREEWLKARLDLLKEEKELTRRSDELARRRQELPWVQIDKQYRFHVDEGSASLADLFRGCSQLLVYHFMFGPDYKAGCPSGLTQRDQSTIPDKMPGLRLNLTLALSDFPFRPDYRLTFPEKSLKLPCHA
jgi:predicted dithiol-disulfide oxidoreductase (DUF899 family)